jgi:hypothetical protein
MNDSKVATPLDFSVKKTRRLSGSPAVATLTQQEKSNSADVQWGRLGVAGFI